MCWQLGFGAGLAPVVAMKATSTTKSVEIFAEVNFMVGRLFSGSELLTSTFL